jgi:hypothetical protein
MLGGYGREPRVFSLSRLKDEELSFENINEA